MNQTFLIAFTVVLLVTVAVVLIPRFFPGVNARLATSSFRKCASPSSAFALITRFAAARTSARAFPIATPSPAFRIIGRSFTSSPIVMISCACTPCRAAMCWIPAHLFTAGSKTSSTSTPKLGTFRS